MKIPPFPRKISGYAPDTAPTIRIDDKLDFLSKGFFSYDI